VIRTEQISFVQHRESTLASNIPSATLWRGLPLPFGVLSAGIKLLSALSNPYFSPGNLHKAFLKLSNEGGAKVYIEGSLKLLPTSSGSIVMMRMV
jgi:hypothetical protein